MYRTYKYARAMQQRKRKLLIYQVVSWSYNYCDIDIYFDITLNSLRFRPPKPKSKHALAAVYVYIYIYYLYALVYTHAVSYAKRIYVYFARARRSPNGIHSEMTQETHNYTQIYHTYRVNE